MASTDTHRHVLVMVGIWVTCIALVHAETSTQQRPKGKAEAIEVTDPRAIPHVSGVEQVHIAPAGPNSMTVSWVTRDTARANVSVSLANGSQQVITCVGSGEVVSALTWYAKDTLLEPDLGKSDVRWQSLMAQQDTSLWAPESASNYWKPKNDTNSSLQWDGDYYGGGSYKNPNAYYTSPVIHTAVCEGLEPSQSYRYKIPGRDDFFQFGMPKAAGENSIKFGVWADVGQTNVSIKNMEAMGALEGLDMVLLPGDLSYADGYYPRWDIWGRLTEPLLSEMPMLIVGGNHEVEAGEAWVPMKMRYPMPWRSSDSISPLWYSYSAGPAHIIGLNSYAAFDQQSLQYQWLEADLKKVNRSVTPWLIAMWHTPWYNSNTVHMEEGYLMQQMMEDILYANGVDIVLNGHVHSYERTYPVYKNQKDRCGPTYLVVGDGGNHEGAETFWVDPQPEWSAFREPSFGIGELDIRNSTHAKWTWHRVSCPSGSFLSSGQGTCQTYKNFNSTDMQQQQPNDTFMIVRRNREEYY